MTEFRYTPDALKMIRVRAAAGDFDWEIAWRLGCDAKTLENICITHGVELKRGSAREPVPVSLDVRALQSFAKEAQLRGKSLPALMVECLEMIARDKMFVAVLDQ
jgi:hypothetical protein